ncbi:HAD family hydrolase [Candidatus Woesearchaeota archaeon]|nr:HAD family hydrolase [Candidatus Woesearchaeota archaeon]
MGVIQPIDAIIFDADGTGIRKPSPAAIAYSLAQLKVTGNRTMHVADTRGDLIASRDVIVPGKEFEGGQNLLMVGAAWGYEGRELLEKGGELPDGAKVEFDYIIDQPEELVAIVQKHWRA